MFEVSPVDDQRHAAPQVGDGMLRTGRARPPRSICARRGERTDAVDQRRREDVCWVADGHAVQTGGDPAELSMAGDDQGEGTRPELPSQREGERRKGCADCRQVRFARDVDDEGVVCGSPLDREDGAHPATIWRACR
jgi:hypothetical protein